MTPEVITATSGLGQYGAIGIVILSIGAIVLIVYNTFRFNANQSELNRNAIAEQASLNRDSYKENTQIMSSALKEVTKIMGKFSSDNKLDHLGLENSNGLILSEIKEVKAKLK